MGLWLSPQVFVSVSLALPGWRGLRPCADSGKAGGDGAPGQAVEPVVVGPGGPGGPFADGPAQGLNIDPLLALGDVAGEELVVGG